MPDQPRRFVFLSFGYTGKPAGLGKGSSGVIFVKADVIGATMAYLNCARCGLEIKIQAAFLRIENCPRCLARSAIVSPLVLSATVPAPPAARCADDGALGNSGQ